MGRMEIMLIDGQLGLAISNVFGPEISKICQEKSGNYTF